MTAERSDDDRGKTVMSGTERIGVVTGVQGGRAAVDPDWDHVDDDLRRTLGGGDEDDDTHTVEESAITAIRNDEVRLRDDLG
jgi:hypothetical protein